MSSKDRTAEFLRLLTTHEVRLRAFALSMLAGNYADADEVLQEATLIAWRKFDEFEPGTNFWAWTGRILYLEAKRLRVRRAKERVRFGEAFFEAVADRAAAPGRGEEMQHRERALGECVARLNSDYRDMLRVRYEEGGTIEHMSEVFGRSVDGIYHALSRIRKLLNDCINLKIQRETT